MASSSSRSSSSSSSKRMFLVFLCLSVAASCAAAQQQGATEGFLPQSDVQPLLGDMIGQGFTVAAAVAQSLQTLIPIRSTLLIPSNAAVAAVTANLSQADLASSLMYHVLDFPTSFDALTRRPVGSELPTMLEGAMLKVTSNSPDDGFAINGANITNPDVCSSTKFVACHGIDKVLLFTSRLATAPAPNAALPPQVSSSSSSVPPEASTSASASAPGTRVPNGTATSSNRNSNSTSGVSMRHCFTGGALLVEMLAASWWLM